MLCSTSLKTFRSFPNKERVSTKERSHSPESFGHMAAHLSFTQPSRRISSCNTVKPVRLCLISPYWTNLELIATSIKLKKYPPFS